MKAYKLIIVAMVVILAFALLTACGTINLRYDETGYTVGSTAVTTLDGVREIEIDWVNGNVIVSHGENFTVKESGDNITSDLTMRTKLVGDTLHVKYMKSGSVNVKNFKKTLEITIPSATGLEELDIDVTNGDINLSVLSLKEIDLECTNGNITLTNVAAEEISLDATTGNIQAIQTTSNEFSAETTTGNVTITTLTTNDFDVDITTGNLTVGDLNTKTAEVELTTGTALVGLSSKITGFTLTPRINSGLVSVNPTSTSYTKENGIYYYGDKSLKLEVEIKTGDLIISLA